MDPRLCALGRGICTALTIEQLAWTAAAGGHDADAAVLLHAAGAVWTGLGTTIAAFGPHIQADSERMAALVRERLGEEGLEAALSGRPTPTKEEAIEIALGMAAAAAGHAPQRPASPRSTSPLTKRERQVAELVAQGLSNKEIGTALVVSPRTVDGHVERALAKLGFSSRTQIAAWVAAQQHR